ncbi:hypothetical protein [Crassaminicella indica]|uniref:t-SNARE coiled-coil homology domain-containing protein n=1 Tax=Crassaminicella indica TaxID=2855394 RepID=A0ABX8RCH2_9CLOT|nr:hypothetical protein [Crassaminicella indica]QXM06754.1 hypothetical protein KVH43_03260 [Crassaminicella indica]
MNNEDKILNLMEKMYVEFSNRFEAIDKRFEDIDRRFEDIDKRLDAMDQRLDAMDQRLDAMDKRLNSLENKVEENKQAIISLENKVDIKLTSLFDGYKQLNEQMERIEEKVDDLQMDVNHLSLKTIHNDNRMLEISRKFRQAK